MASYIAKMTELLPDERETRFSVRTLADDHAAGVYLAPHCHDEAQVVYARQGVMRVSVEGDLWVLPPLRALLIAPRTEHAIDCRTTVSLRTLYLSGREAALLPRCQVIAVSALLRATILRLTEGPVLEGQRPLLEALAISELRAQSVEPLSLPQPRDRRLLRIATAWAEQPADPRSLKDWAVDLAMSERSLIRAIRRDCGMTFRQWHRQARLLAALEGLAAGHSVTTAALDCGYESLSAFVQAFREVFGVTPARYFEPDRNRSQQMRKHSEPQP